ncbi:hypothetical protein TNCV_3615981 [Trichonephila clavipes]|nr:hypothetical protein TNCV_3615981 [Trichonephila clavipes]
MKQVQSFLGLTEYFRKDIKDYSKIAKPLSDLTRKENLFVFFFGTQQKEAFEKLKKIMSESPILHIYKYGRKTELHTDACKQGYGAILLQEAEDGKLHPVYYKSKKTNTAEEKYDSYELEALQLEEFDYEIEHRAGSRMKHVDALSRYPVMIVCNDTLTSKLKKAQEEDDNIQTLKSLLENYQHIFTVVDAFTKFTWLYPVKTVSAESALEKLKQQQKTFGNPIRIISDRGSAFTSKLFNDYCDEENIQHLQIATGVPRGNGQVERIHQTLIPVLTKLSLDDSTKWYKYVDRLQRILNSTICRSTKWTPFELLGGTKMRNKEDILIKDLLLEEMAKELLEQREFLRNDAKKNIETLQSENRKTYNRRRKKASLYKGDLVAIQRTQFGAGLKLRPKFLGPYKVTKVNSKDSRSLPPNYYGHLALADKRCRNSSLFINSWEGISELGLRRHKETHRQCVLFAPDPVTTERLETHNVYPDIGAHGARAGMRQNRWDRLRDNSSKEPSLIGAEKGQNIRG